MRVLILSARAPWPPFTGDRLRTLIWMESLAGEEVTLISPPSVNLPASVAHRPVTRSYVLWLRDALRALFGGMPLQALLSGGFDWTGAITSATKERGPFDAMIVLLSRLHPWVERAPRAGINILDAVDSLARSMQERARSSPFPLRWFWNLEATKTEKLERRAAQRYGRVVIVSAEEADCFDRAVDIVSNGVVIGRPSLPDHARRRFDFGFWGRFPYFANRDAANVLMSTIWPAIRSRVPGATLLIAGAEAPRGIRRLDGVDGISVISPVPEMSALIREVRVALFPVRYGTGQSNKLLEAAEASCGIVGTRAALRSLDRLEDAVIEDDPVEFARKAVALLQNPEDLSRRSAALRRAVETYYSRAATLRFLRALLQPTEERR